MKGSARLRRIKKNLEDEIVTGGLGVAFEIVKGPPAVLMTTDAGSGIYRVMTEEEQATYGSVLVFGGEPVNPDGDGDAYWFDQMPKKVQKAIKRERAERGRQVRALQKARSVPASEKQASK